MIRITTILFVLVFASQQLVAQHFASGIKIGEVDQTSAIVWARLTEKSKANFDLLKRELKHPMPDDIVPGQRGEMRLELQSKMSKNGNFTVRINDWIAVGKETDFTHQFSLSDLEPDTGYKLTIHSREQGADSVANSISGSFRTAPVADESVPVRFIVTTCQAVRTVDSGKEGHAAYAKMLDFDPHFFVHTGDIVYYDKKPLAKTVAQARAKWNLIFSYGYNKTFHQQVPSYFMKDDHDTLKNDCWPGQSTVILRLKKGCPFFASKCRWARKRIAPIAGARTCRFG